MAFTRPVFFMDGEPKEEDRELFIRLWRDILAKGQKKRWPLVADVLREPDLYGPKSPIRQEILKMVGSTLEKLGYDGKKTDREIESQLCHWMRVEQQKGGLF